MSNFILSPLVFAAYRRYLAVISRRISPILVAWRLGFGIADIAARRRVVVIYRRFDFGQRKLLADDD